MITPVNSYNTYSYNQNYRPTFQARSVGSVAQLGEQSARSVEFAGRKIINKFIDIFKKEQNPELFDKLLETKTESPEYIQLVSAVGRNFATKNVININTESNRIQEIASSGKPHIFIMNHDNQSQDPKMLAFFNTMLNEEYLRTGQGATCPRAKIILNEDIVRSMNKRKQSIFEKIGAVPIDASIHNPNRRGNTLALKKLMSDFLHGEANIYIFPEGKLSVFTKSPLEEKFQTGAGELVTKLAQILGEVRVTPLGFAYGKGKKGENCIHVGETIIFRKNGKELQATQGNITSEFAQDSFKNFFNNRTEATITSNSVPVIGREQSKYVGGILCENLRICKEEAKSTLNKNDTSSPIIDY